QPASAARSFNSGTSRSISALEAGAVRARDSTRPASTYARLGVAPAKTSTCCTGRAVIACGGGLRGVNDAVGGKSKAHAAAKPSTKMNTERIMWTPLGAVWE